jgi:cytochrome c-type biogenesis protein CcmH/NrfG
MIRAAVGIVFIASSILVLVSDANAQQADDICREFGETPTREVGRDNRLIPYVFGRILLKGISTNAKPVRVTAIYSDSLQPAIRQLVGKSGNYCFQKRGTGGALIIDVDGVEVARKSVSDISSIRQREDFEVYPPQALQTAPPGVVNTRFARPPNERTIDLYRRAAEAEAAKQTDDAIEIIKQIVVVDATDFIAWAKLGSMLAERNSLAEAEAALKRALVVRPDYTPAMLNIGLIKAMQTQYPEAIRMFERAVAADPTSARAYRLLGEAYLQVRRGTDGLAALSEAISIDPVGMADCHLLRARLYDLAGAKNLAAQEYKAFLKKVPDHVDKKKFEKYVKDNPG